MEVCKQQQAIDLINSGENIFLTGAGGVGKSYVIKKVTTPNTLLLAPTGIAALNIGGSTCHKAFKLPLGLPTDKDKSFVHKDLKSLFSGNKVTRIIIDEVGMLRTDVLELINTRLQKVKGNKLPFGGIQMVLVGDFFQLEPIVNYQERTRFNQLYESPFCFSSEVFADFHTIELTKVYRQEDERQVKILEALRKGTNYKDKALQCIIQEAAPYDQTQDKLHLCAYKKDAEKVNQYWANQLKGKTHTFRAKLGGKKATWSEAPVPLEVKLKIGSKVIICANSPDESYVNGDRGTVTGISKTFVTVKLLDGREVEVDEFTWEKYGYKGTGKGFTKMVESSMAQIPLALGWAISIHKSQGMTLEDVVLDTGKGCFSHGQLYVALSRIKDLRRLSLTKPIELRELIVKQEVKDFYNKIEHTENLHEETV